MRWLSIGKLFPYNNRATSCSPTYFFAKKLGLMEVSSSTQAQFSNTPWTLTQCWTVHHRFDDQVTSQLALNYSSSVSKFSSQNLKFHFSKRSMSPKLTQNNQKLVLNWSNRFKNYFEKVTFHVTNRFIVNFEYEKYLEHWGSYGGCWGCSSTPNIWDSI